ncbi:MAG: hypothetical protein KDC33_07615 [Thermoleophilia bacterium]|nr:hypothetical protein [Thermoleophilia bacterium]
MSVLSHVYDVPSDDELEALMGAAAPHFALQIRGRIRSYLDRLPADHPRRPALEAQLQRMHDLGFEGERGAAGPVDLPPLDPRTT